MRAATCKRISSLIAVLTLAVVATPLGAADFYAGRRVTLLINFAAGGPTDVEGRLFAKHLARVLAGSPAIIAQNMDGAGGLIGVNYMGEVAPKDGSMIGYLTGAAWQYVGDPNPRRVDFKAYEFVAYQPGTSIYFMRTDVRPGIKQPTDIMQAQGLIAGGLSVDGPKDLLIRLTLDILGLKYKYVTGYRGSQGARLALQQGEINLYAESPPSFRSIIEPQLVAKGEVIGLYYDAIWDGERFRTPKQVEGMSLAPFHEFYAKIHGRQPSGRQWEAYKTIVALNASMQRMIVLPPGAPQAAIDALRAAITRLNDDREFIDDAQKTFGYAPEFVAAPDTSEKVRQALATDPDTKAFMVEFMNAATK